MALNPKCPLFPQVLFIPIKEIGIQGTLGTWGHSYRVVSPMSTSRGQGTSGDNVHNVHYVHSLQMTTTSSRLKSRPTAHASIQKSESRPKCPPKNHRYRIGRVQRGVRRAFLVAPEWTTRELMEWTHAFALYRGRRSRWQRHDYAKSVRRAADQVAVRLGRRWPDGVLWRLK